MAQDRTEAVKVKMEKNKPCQRRAQKKISESYLHNSGLYYLQRFAASTSQFRSVMMRKVKKSCLHHTDQDYESCTMMVDALVEKFVRAGLLNDELFTQGLVASLRRRGLSRKAILSKMLQKGIVSEKAAQALDDYDLENYQGCNGGAGHDAEFTAALVFARRKKIGPYNSTEAHDHQKDLAKFARAGFSYDTSRRVLLLTGDEIEALR